MNSTVFQNIFNSESLSDSSKKLYKRNLEKLMEVTQNRDLKKLAQNPDKVFQFLQTQDVSNASKKSMIAAMMSAIKHSSALFNLRDDDAVLESWREKMAKVQEQLDQKNLSGQLTPAEQDKWIEWKNVLRCERHIRKTEYASIKHLLIAMYVYIEPLRSDFGNVKLFFDAVDTNYKNNYIFIDTTEPEKSFLELVTYKTSGKYGNKRIILPGQLVHIISTSVQSYPREYLFVNKYDEPFEKRNSFTVFSNRIFEEIFGKKVTVNILRHSRISSIRFDDSRPIELQNIASKMGHSLGMQQRYRRLDETTPPPPQPGAPRRGGGIILERPHGYK